MELDLIFVPIIQALMSFKDIIIGPPAGFLVIHKLAYKLLSTGQDTCAMAIHLSINKVPFAYFSLFICHLAIPCHLISGESTSVYLVFFIVELKSALSDSLPIDEFPSVHLKVGIDELSETIELSILSVPIIAAFLLCWMNI